jgi:hypothetical protein
LGRLLATRRGVRLGGVEGVETADARGSLCPTVPGSFSSQDTGLACHDIMAADLFDRVVPSDSAPPGGRTARERQRAVARHVQSCPACLGRVRTLQRTIGEIMARADSEVVTVYHADNDTDEAQSEYPYPVSVQVLHGAVEAAGAARDVRAALATGLRRLERSAMPLAALVLIGIALTTLLRTTTPTASGTSLGDVDKTEARMKNIHVVVTSDLDAKPVQEYWIARRSSIVVSKTGQNCVLYDLENDCRRTLDLQSGVRTSERLRRGDEAAQRARQFTAGYLRSELTEVAPNTKLDRAAGEIDSGTGRALDVYELPLPPDVKDSLPRRRWLYVDPADGLPRKMVSSRQRPGENPGDSVTTTSFTYLTGPAMAQEIERLFPPQ